MSSSAPATIDFAARRYPLAHRMPPRDRLPTAQDNIVLHCTSTERFGLRGPGTMDWLASEGLGAPAVNEAVSLPCGTTVMRLGQQEVLLTAPIGSDGDRLRELRTKWLRSTLPSKGYDAGREEGWAWFVVSGPAAPDLMRRISMADMRPQGFASGNVAQTRALNLDVVIVRLDRFGAVSYDIFFDIASAEFAVDVVAAAAASLSSGFELASLGSG